MGKHVDGERFCNIYKMIDPRNSEVRYIGKTVSTIRARLLQHLDNSKQEGRKSSPLVYTWIQELATLNLIPLIELIETVKCKYGFEREAYWIAFYPKLLNMVTEGTGGLGSKRNPEQVVTLKKALRNVAPCVYRYTLEGVYIDKFNSAVEAAERLELCRTNISQVCSVEKKSHGGFIFSHLTPDEFKLQPYIHDAVDYTKKDFSNNNFVANKKRVIITNTETKEKFMVNSVKEASEKTGVNKPSISRVCTGKQKTIRGRYLFEYERVTE